MEQQLINLTREDLAVFIKDPRTIRAFENLGANQDTVWQGQLACKLYVGSAGDVVLIDAMGAQTTIYSVAAGTTIETLFSMIVALNTSAFDFTVFWE